MGDPMEHRDDSAEREDRPGPRRRHPPWAIGMGCLVAFVVGFGVWLAWLALMALGLLLAGRRGQG
jgi:hypothetical protein